MTDHMADGRGAVEKRFFAASNSSEGFRSYYGDCFGEGSGVDRLYIIKGGPGTGKSHFMRTVGQYAQAQGYEVTWYHCSSDAASLDGVKLMAEGKPCIGLLDGTPPHVCEPTVPGVREEIVNLGIFWNGNALAERSAQIRALGKQKSATYELAYRYLAACGEMDTVADRLMDSCVHLDRLSALAGRILRSQPTGGVFSATPALQCAVGMTGRVRLDTYARMAAEAGGEIIRLDDYYGLGFRLTDLLLKQSRERGLRVLLSRDPVNAHKIDALFYPDTGLCVLVATEEECPETHRTIPLRRYVDARALKEIRAEVRCARGLYGQMLDGACRCLGRMAKYHFAMEQIYSAAMDFPAETAFCERFCEQVLGGSV